MEEPISFSPNQQVGTSKKKSPLIAIVIIIVLILIGGFFLLRQSKKTNQTKITITPTNEPSPTPQPKIDKKSVKIQVKNGTGTPGQAGIAVTELKNAGYSLDNIKTANADVFNDTVTTITAKDGFDEIATDIKNALLTKFTDATVDSTHLDKGSEFDIVIVTGGKKFEEPTSAPSPTSTVTPTPTGTVTPTLTNTPTPTP